MTPSQSKAKVAVEWVTVFKSHVEAQSDRSTNKGSMFIDRDEALEIIAILELLRPIAEGTHVIVPVEPTPEMIKAGFDFWCICSGPHEHFAARIYNALIEAPQKQE
jgi:hypothetical protein